MPGRFLADCGGPFDLTAQHTITCWDSQPTTPQELAITAFMKAEPQRFSGKHLLHVGIGNCHLPTELAAGLAGYVGITISRPEIDLFEHNFAGVKHARVLLLNKYDPRMYAALTGQFDIVVDINLRGYACCEKHFRDMMTFFYAKLKRGGTLVTTERGAAWGWSGNTNRAYTPGMQLDPSIAKLRALPRDEIGELALHFGLAISEAYHPATDEHILLLRKV